MIGFIAKEVHRDFGFDTEMTMYYNGDGVKIMIQYGNNSNIINLTKKETTELIKYLQNCLLD